MHTHEASEDELAPQLNTFLPGAQSAKEEYELKPRTAVPDAAESDEWGCDYPVIVLRLVITHQRVELAERVSVTR
jgi:hypothetical protein